MLFVGIPRPSPTHSEHTEENDKPKDLSVEEIRLNHGLIETF